MVRSLTGGRLQQADGDDAERQQKDGQAEQRQRGTSGSQGEPVMNAGMLAREQEEDHGPQDPAFRV